MNVTSWMKYKNIQALWCLRSCRCLTFFVCFLFILWAKKEKKWSRYYVIQLRYSNCAASLNVVWIMLMTHTTWICDIFDVANSLQYSPLICCNAFPMVPCTLPAVFVANLQTLWFYHSTTLFITWIFVQFCVATGWNCYMFYHLCDSVCV